MIGKDLSEGAAGKDEELRSAPSRGVSGSGVQDRQSTMLMSFSRPSAVVGRRYVKGRNRLKVDGLTQVQVGSSSGFKRRSLRMR